MRPPRPDPVVQSARREAAFVLVIWLIMLAYTVTYCYLNGYGRTIDDLTFVLGFPDWVFWGIVAPWTFCVVLSWVFGCFVMTDADLGEGMDEGDDDGDT